MMDQDWFELSGTIEKEEGDFGLYTDFNDANIR